MKKKLSGQLISWYNNTNIIITGGGGYLGTNLAKKLVDYSCKIYLIDLKFNNEAILLNKNHSNLYLKVLNLFNINEVENYIKKVNPNLIYHFAASLNRTRNFLYFPEIYKTNVEILYNLLMGLKSQNYKGFYFSSTSELYGNVDNPPFYENQVTNPVSPYSLTKNMAEKLLISFSKLNRKPYTILRIFNFFGPSQPTTTFIGEMLDTYLKGEIFKMTKGEQERDYLFIDELIEQIKHVSASKNENEIYNLCSGKGISLNEIVEKLSELSNNKFQVEKEIPYRDNEIMKIIGSNEKMLKTGYKPKELDLKKAIQKCLLAKNS